MRAFVVTGRAIAGFYQYLFLLAGTSALWWLTGGVLLGLAVFFGWPMLKIGGPLWLVPLIAIPVGPATAALANVTHRVAREFHVDQSYYWEGFRTYWRMALGVNAISMGILAILSLNLLFYITRPDMLRILGFFWLYLLVFWFSVQLYLFPVLVGLEKPSVLGALRTATILAFANPLFSILLLALALILTSLSIVIPLLLLLAWPALVVLQGSQALRLFVERMAGPKPEEPKTDGDDGPGAHPDIT